jgi:O-6-methylguanine DNA methyltransferase
VAGLPDGRKGRHMNAALTSTTTDHEHPPGMSGFALFDTCIGRCGVAWTNRGIAALQLPEADAERTVARPKGRLPWSAAGTPPTHVRRAIDLITALLAGTPADLRDIELDMVGVSDFPRHVYEAARDIPAGSTVTYAELAQRIGAPRTARAIGHALARNPFAVIVPCHRLLRSGGQLGGFSATGVRPQKRSMLAAEGVEMPETGSIRRSRLRFDPSAIAHIHEVDPTLGSVIDTAGPMTLEPTPTPDLFVGLSEAIVYQQLSEKAAATIYGRLQAILAGQPGHDVEPKQVLTAGDDKLRAAGLSRPKIRALRDLAERSVAGKLPNLAVIRKMDDESVIDRLTEIRGIGRWSAQMFLIFRLGRPDVLPADDLGLRRGFAAVFGGPTPQPGDVLRHGERWRPYRTTATWYLWRVVDSGGL